MVRASNQLKSVSTLNLNQNLNQSVCFYSLFLLNCPLNYSQRGFIGPIPFDSTQAEKRGVDPAELVGKVFVNAYPISAKPDDEGTGLPGSFGFAFRDGSKYHVRIYEALAAGSLSEVHFDDDEDDLEGKRVTAASFLRYEGRFLYNYEFSVSTGLKEYITLGIKVEGIDDWVLFSGTEERYGFGDGDIMMAVREYYDVYLVKMKGGPVKKGRSKKY